VSKFKTQTEKILEAIPRTEVCSFGEFCQAYSDTPEKGDKAGWGKLLSAIDNLAGMEQLIEVDREGGLIAYMRLTTDGAAELKRLQQQAF